jgi:tRNA-specific 2-thiouridylase
MPTLKKILVGMSGGVDSAAAAVLLKEQGYELAGATFTLHGDNAADCADAKAVCDALGIPHYTLDFREPFRAEVLEPFAREYESGRTPNPCVLCNRAIKFGAFLSAARELGYDGVATGHYAILERDETRGIVRVKRAAHLEKDQSYVLYSLTREQLAAMALPLGEYSKPQVRAIAEKHGLPVVHRPESQDICFVPDGDYAAFLRGYLGAESEPGDFVAEDGTILGRHRGIRHYTVGQRRGIAHSFSELMYVAAIDAAANTVTLAPNAALMRTSLNVKGVNWLEPVKPGKPLRLDVKIRYGAKTAAATVTPCDDGANVEFDEPQRAITPGQSAVFYSGEYLVGGGVIVNSDK